MSRHFFPSLFAFLGAWLLAGLSQAAEIAHQMDAIAARVNGRPILLSQIREAALDLDVPLESLRMEGLEGEGFKRAITALVDEELLVQEALKQEIQVDDTELARRVDDMIGRLKKQLGGAEEFNRFLSRTHLNMDALRSMLHEREMRTELVAQVVGRRVHVKSLEVQEFKRQSEKSGEQTEEVFLAQIFVRLLPGERGTEAGQERYEKALDAAREVSRDREKFAEVVLRVSDDAATREQGGVLGWINPASLREPLRKRVRSMGVDEISEPIADEDGYHVIYLMNRRDARDILFAKRFYEERKKLLNALREQASIEIYPPRTEDG